MNGSIVPYDKARFQGDKSRAWMKTKPYLKRGLLSPWNAATDPKTNGAKEMVRWLKMWGHAFLFIFKFAFYGLRLWINK